MEKIGSEGKESIDGLLIKEINHLKRKCQGRGIELREGVRVTAYCVRPVESLLFSVGCVSCRECGVVPREQFTLTADELVVDGRVGRCVDVATQSSWSVVLASALRVVSAAGAVHATRRFDRADDRRVSPACTAARGRGRGKGGDGA